MNLRTHTQSPLRDNDIQDPNSISLEEWIADVSLWPRIDPGKVFSYIINKKAFKTEYIGQYKARKAYSYFMSSFAHEIVVYCPSQHKVLLKGNAIPSQRIREKPWNVWVLFSKNGDVICANYSCTAGFGECSNHVVAIPYKVECANSQGLVDQACTAVACAWNKSAEKEVEPQKVKDLVLKKHDSLKPTKNTLYKLSAKEILMFDRKKWEAWNIKGWKNFSIIWEQRAPQQLHWHVSSPHLTTLALLLWQRLVIKLSVSTQVKTNNLLTALSWMPCHSMSCG